LLVSAFAASQTLAQDSTEETTQTPEETESPPDAPAEIEFILYTVQPGDTLNRIANRFNTTIAIIAADNGIVNANQIFTGQQLRIRPAGAPTPTPSATPIPPTAPPPVVTPVPGATTTYTVASGDTLFRIAVRFNTTVAELMALNNLPNPNVIQVGQTLIIPAAPGAPTATPLSTATSTPIAEATPVPVEIEANFGFGIHVAATAANADQLAEQVSQLGMDWVSVVARWRDMEPAQGQIDFSTLDAIVQAFEARGLNILITLTSAPVWARTSTDEAGPPDDPQTFAVFAGQVAGRYAGRVNAYEIWSEPNLRREWNSNVHAISATSYLDLLRPAYAAIKAADPAAIVVSAGLAPTGFNDGVNAINDRLYLSSLYAAGLADVSDAIGAHPGGWANPPDALCCSPAVGVETHYEDPSFYFLETLNAYRDIMVANNDGGTPIWVTKFGWGTSADTEPPAATYIYMSYTSLAEQAIYVPRAFSLGQELGYIGPMFLYNLNGCEGPTATAESCYFSLIGPDGQPRPVFNAVAALVRSETPGEDTLAGPELTLEPTVVPPVEEIDPLLLTATAIIEGATATAIAEGTPQAGG